jgi:hypothetical protein
MERIMAKTMGTPDQKPTHEEIARRAYALFEKSGRVAGRDMQNWLEAEAQLKAAQPQSAQSQNAQTLSAQTQSTQSRNAQTRSAQPQSTPSQMGVRVQAKSASLQSTGNRM